ncbi:MAG: hypothetical protein K2N94_09575 [Lachnospiraceae bacterium]|nr:hypothetical protein [Lachnospiraceae bacterium]
MDLELPGEVIPPLEISVDLSPVLAGQQEILAGQQEILAGQQEILTGQQEILTCQQEMLTCQQEILACGKVVNTLLLFLVFFEVFRLGRGLSGRAFGKRGRLLIMLCSL